MQKLCVFFGVIVLGFCQSLYCGWNEEFDASSRSVIETFLELQGDSYMDSYAFFSAARNSLLKDSSLRKQCKGSSDEDRFRIIDDVRGIVIKKRQKQRIHELYVWEVSCLLGASEFVVPSFPVEIAGQKMIVQPMEFFAIGRGEEKVPPSSFVKKVPLHEYWKSHLAAYIMGLGDLVGINIGVNSRGVVRFFDTESSFRYVNQPRSVKKLFKTGFVMESFEWPHYRKALSEQDVEELERFILGLSQLEEKIERYLEYRPFEVDLEGLFYRLAKVRSFSFEAGRSFREFYGYLFPRMNEGLDELNHIVGHIVKRRVDHGASILFACRRQEHYKMSSEERKSLQKWINVYIGEEL